MPSPDGRGVAKSRWQRGWDAYSKAVKTVAEPVLGPALRPALEPLARTLTFDLIGFYFAWHMHGGFEGLQRDLGMSRSAVYRRIALFRRLMGQHPDEYVMPGMGLDVAAYLARKPYGQGPAAPDVPADDSAERVSGESVRLP
jgi:hypothetical protein